MRLTTQDISMIKVAYSILKPKNELNETANCGCVLITQSGKLYRGINLGFLCGIGTCAELQAIGSMILNSESTEIRTMVTTSFSERENKLKILLPCGKCREMIYQLNKKNMKTEVIISETEKVYLSELLPKPCGLSIKKKCNLNT